MSLFKLSNCFYYRFNCFYYRFQMKGRLHMKRRKRMMINKNKHYNNVLSLASLPSPKSTPTHTPTPIPTTTQEEESDHEYSPMISESSNLTAPPPPRSSSVLFGPEAEIEILKGLIQFSKSQPNKKAWVTNEFVTFINNSLRVGNNNNNNNNMSVDFTKTQLRAKVSRMKKKYLKSPEKDGEFYELSSHLWADRVVGNLDQIVDEHGGASGEYWWLEMDKKWEEFRIAEIQLLAQKHALRKETLEAIIISRHNINKASQVPGGF